MTDDDSCSNDQSGDSVASDDTEQEVFALLFQNCDKDQSGVVDRDQLVDYIEQQTKEGQEHEVRYNLDLLREMLRCSTKGSSVDEATYTRVIRKWVQEVRSKSSSPIPSTEEPPPEDDVTLEHSSSYLGSAEVSKESLEASGGTSSHSSEHDQREQISSLKMENKRLQDLNHDFHHQIEQWEENVTHLTLENNELKLRVKNLQQNVGRLQGKEKETHQELIKEQERHSMLQQQLERQEQELHQLNGELTKMRSNFNALNADTIDADREKQDLKQQLLQKEELIEKYAMKQKELEIVHKEHQVTIDSLERKIQEMSGINESLRSENSELQGRLIEPQGQRRFPVSSTPFRPSLTFHEELLECSMNANVSVCPQSDDSLEVADQSMDEFTKVLNETRTQIREKTELLDKGLTELISADDTPSGSSSRLEANESVGLYEQFESKLSELAKSKRQSDRKANKLASDLRKLRAENQKLKDQLEKIPKAPDHQKDEGSAEVNVQPVGRGDEQPVTESERMPEGQYVSSYEHRTGEETPNVCAEPARECTSSALEDRPLHVKEGPQSVEQLYGIGVGGNVQSYPTTLASWLWMLVCVFYWLLKTVLLMMVIVLVSVLLVVLITQWHSNNMSCSISPFRVLFSMFGHGAQINHHGPIRM